MSEENDGAKWLRQQDVQLSELGIKVAGILDRAWFGIYHLWHSAREASKRGTDFSNDRYIEVVIQESLATWDGCKLTDLVILCHDAAIRLDVSGMKGLGMPRLHLMFHARQREGGMSQRHPTIEDAIARVRGSL